MCILCSFPPFIECKEIRTIARSLDVQLLSNSSVKNEQKQNKIESPTFSILERGDVFSRVTGYS